jgi:hypothetical protein
MHFIPNRRSRWTLAIIGVTLIAGCQKSHPDMVPVSGQVTIDGQPVTHGQITVMPEGRRASIGKLDAEGRFSLSCFAAGDGAPIGTHIATVTAVEALGEHANRWHAPKKYASKSGGVWVVIDGPTKELNVPLSWANESERAPFVDRF